MKPHMRKQLVTCALLAGIGATAVAQQVPAPAPATTQIQGHHDPARKAERVAKRLSDLKQKLQVTQQQEPAWTSFANAMQPSDTAQRPDRDAIARMTTPDRIDHMRALRERRNTEMDRRAEATKSFYGQLSAEQKRTFDAETARLFQRSGHHNRQHG